MGRSVDIIASPHEKFSGVKLLDYKCDLRVKFGEWCQATVPVTNNWICKIWVEATGSVVVRDQFVLLLFF